MDCATLISQNHIPFLISEILKWPIDEASTNNVDYCFGGLIDMLRMEIDKCNSLKNEIKSSIELVKGLLERLFNIDGSGSKCRNSRTRSKALKLLTQIADNFSESSTLIREYLDKLPISGN